MRRWFSSHRKQWLAGMSLVLILVLGGLAWLERNTVLAWYYVRGLARAGESERNTWVKRVAGLDNAAAPELIRCLRRDENSACANAQICLLLLLKRWGANDRRSEELTDRLAEQFASFSPQGQKNALEIGKVLLSSGSSLHSLASMLRQSARIPHSDVRNQAMTLMENLLEKPAAKDLLDACQELTHACLRDENGEIRVRAVRLAVHPGIDLPGEIVPLLHDASADVRRSALLAIGPLAEAIATDDLLPCLHDSDADVRRICEWALRGRGLQEHHLKMAKLVTDKRPAVRLQVLEQLEESPELEPGAWLRRLSHDAEPMVRAAVLRAAADHPLVDLGDRIEQMAQNDPSPTVRQLARYYGRLETEGRRLEE